MDAVRQINTAALIQIKGARQHLTAQQYRTLRGQVLAGDDEGALKGLRKILLLGGSNAIERGAET